MAAIFFDIDGTLWDRDNNIPQSTKEAIHQLQENGHQTFLCSGRTRVFINSEELLGMGFDGIVCGCGTFIEYKGKEMLIMILPWLWKAAICCTWMQTRSAEMHTEDICWRL